MDKSEELLEKDQEGIDDISFKKLLNKESSFLHQVQLQNNYRQEYSFKKWKENYGRKKYLLGFRCLSEDVYRNLLEPRYSDFGDYYSGESPIYCSKFGESQNTKSILCLGYESGQICLQKIKKRRRSDETIVKSCHTDAVYDTSWISNENSLLSASADTAVSLWHLKNEDLIKVQTFSAHERSVKCVSTNSLDRNVFASGDSDGRLIIWDTRCSNNKIANEIWMSHTHQRSFTRQPVKNSIKCLLFNEEHKIISAGTSDGMVKIWDLRRTYSIKGRLPQSLARLNLPTCSGVTSMTLSPFKERLYISCLNGKIYCFHITTPLIEPVAVYFGFSRFNTDCKSCLSPCGSYLLSGSCNADAYIWSTNSPGCPIVSLTGHEDPVTTVAWSEDDMLVTCDDIKYRIFKCDNITQVNSEKEQENITGFAESLSEKCFFQELLSINPADSSQTECVTHGLKLSTSEELSQVIEKRNNTNTFPQTCLTPSNDKLKSKGEKTPKTEEKGTLFSWLSSSKKNPNSDSLLVTPKSTKTPSKSITSKRKLSVLLENNQENINEEDKKLALSPTKNILCERKNSKNNSNTTAKMLTYDDNLKKKEKSESELSEDDFELINDDSHPKESKFSSLRLNSLNEQNLYPNLEATTPVRNSSINPRTPNLTTPVRKASINPGTPSHLSPVNNCLLTSPTANLPNYVVDGRSPHNRGESPRIQKREVDWLTSFRKTKNSFAKGMEHLAKNEKPKSNCKKRKGNSDS